MSINCIIQIVVNSVIEGSRKSSKYVKSSGEFVIRQDARASDHATLLHTVVGVHALKQLLDRLFARVDVLRKCGRLRFEREHSALKTSGLFNPP